MKQDAQLPTECPSAGMRIYGTISQVNSQMGYGYIAYRENPEFQFIFPTGMVKDPKVGREAIFILNKDLTVDQMALKPVLERTQQSAPAR